MTAGKPLWAPSQKRIEDANLTRFARMAIRDWNLNLNNYPAFYEWSAARPEEFWQSVWKFGEVRGEMGSRILIDGDKMPGARFFPDAKLNFAENSLRCRDTSDAIVFWGEDKVKRRLSHADLYDQVSRLAQALRTLGIGEGDRIAGFLPNMPETVIAMLATASLGAIWSSCSPDFGVQGVLDRFGQITPKLLFTADGYWYNGKSVEVLDKVREMAAKLPSVRRVIVVSYLDEAPKLTPIPNAEHLRDFVAPYASREIDFARMPFNHPLYILYSSGTTGVPKCIVHSGGGALLKHLSEQLLHSDIKPGDRFFYFTTCGWMMWNWLASGLASGATLLLYDGSPFVQGGNVLFDYADAARMTHFGTSAKFIDEAKKRELKPIETHGLEAVRVLMSTGSPLAPESFDYVYQAIKRDVLLASMSGGTDLCGCFVLGNPILPVMRGEIQCRALGLAVDVFDDEGRPVRGEKGELVCTKPFPSMPIGFWNDPDGAKYRTAYFERFPNVWCHGDYCELTPHGGMVIYGRSDAVLNPGGVRIGTAEIYRQVEQLEEVVESLVIGQEWERDVRVVLFVRLRDGVTLDDELGAKIKQKIRANTTPRHVPAKIVQVLDIPRTKSGKIVELAVRNVVHGQPVKNVEALANPEALDHFRDRVELRS
jgi:acetoacetyl-CoA synthetase